MHCSPICVHSACAISFQACQGDWTIMEKCPKELERIYWKDQDFVVAALSQSIDALKLERTCWWSEVPFDLVICCHLVKCFERNSSLTSRPLVKASFELWYLVIAEEKSSRVILGGQGGDACCCQDRLQGQAIVAAIGCGNFPELIANDASLSNVLQHSGMPTAN